MCPLCLTSLAVTVATTTGAGAAAVAVATRVAKSLARRAGTDAAPSVTVESTREEGGAR
jgi:hypothetical protein